jgi:hypothetical protein
MDSAYNKHDWQQQRVKLRERWDRMSEQDLDEIAGDRTRLAKRIQEVYGISADDAERQVRDWEAEQDPWDPSSAEGPNPIIPGSPAKGEESAASGQAGGRTWQRPPEVERGADFDAVAPATSDAEAHRMQSTSGAKVHGDKLGNAVDAARRAGKSEDSR